VPTSPLLLWRKGLGHHDEEETMRGESPYGEADGDKGVLILPSSTKLRYPNLIIVLTAALASTFP